MNGRAPLLHAFSDCRRGVAAIEFALVAPVLFLVLVLAIETGRIFLAYAKFENAMSGVARDLASYAEYDSDARQHAALVATQLLPTDAAGRFNLQVTSLRNEANAMSTVFTHTLVGTDPDLPLPDNVAPSQFATGEVVIHLAATYTYTPLVNVLGNGITLRKTYTIMPFFSRNYVWNAGQAADKYVR
jgi:Flp pilus assembly protein TadG